jgi:hypothetical protein
MKTTTAAVAIGAAMLIAGCGASAAPARPTAAHTAQAAPAAPALPANPVTVVQATGAAPDAGEQYGHSGVEDDQVAHGMFPGGEEVWVFTYATAALRAYWVAHPALPPQDGETDILGPAISLIFVDAASAADPGGPSPQQIAARVHGTVLAGR